ncbi:helix-turn-helix domain-containing protein [Streptomyces sp. NPDC051956]|uniref:helix-turn-helix domain-containing protein n=1 Tax=Streptomyces sp. NPDC051956 TaxID=3365677 RepID=UPI0037CEE370
MMEQPLFGRRLKELRKDRGLSQASLAGGEISTGYLSRLESGARQPTDRVITYLAGQLGVSRAAFATPTRDDSLARALSIALSTDDDEDVKNLVDVLKSATDTDPFLRWQALWLVARLDRRDGAHTQELEHLTEAAQVAQELALPELQCRTWTRLARCLRATGRTLDAISLAAKAHRLAQGAELPVTDVGQALLVLVSAEAEAGHLPDARDHVDELVELLPAHPSTLKTEALWSAATVRSRQGEHQAALDHIEQAMRELDSRLDLTLWARLRLAAASHCLHTTPPLTARARECLQEAEAALTLVGTPALRQELLTLQAHLAFQEGDFAAARAAHDELCRDELRLSYRDRIRLRILDSRLLLLEGHHEQGRRQLKELGEQAKDAAIIDLAAEIWRLLAEALEEAASARPPA